MSTPRQVSILRHALGLEADGCGHSYRCYFVTGPGSDDFDDCEALVSLGAMTKHAGFMLSGGDPVFLVTNAGIAIATLPAREPNYRGIYLKDVSVLPGERYIGAILKDDGSIDYHLVWLGINTEGLDHASAIAWAKTLDGKIANKREIRLVQANASDLLPSSGWCWLGEENGSSGARCCHFYDGGLDSRFRSSEGGAVAVRRVNP